MRKRFLLELDHLILNGQAMTMTDLSIIASGKKTTLRTWIHRDLTRVQSNWLANLVSKFPDFPVMYILTGKR